MADGCGRARTCVSKDQRKAGKKLKKVQQTLFRHDKINTSVKATPHLVVGNGGLDNNVDRESLEEIFHPHGHVCDIVMQPQKPYSFVTYSTSEESEKACNALHGSPLKSNPTVILYITYVEQVPGMNIPALSLPPGLILIKDFVTEEQEKEILSAVDWNISQAEIGKDLKHRKVRHYGYEFIYGINNVTPDNPLEEGIPSVCDAILDDMVQREYFIERPDQLTVNQYQPGQGIPPHTDTHSAFDGAIVSLSLGSQAVMDFVDPDGHQAAVLLPQRSLVVMTGESRYAWTHAITPRKSDIVRTETANGDQLTLVKRGVRTSFTFRHLRRKPCDCNYPKQCDSQQAKTTENTCSAMPKSTEEAQQLEETHVHKVYEEIASHFSATRHSPWPQVMDFLQSLPSGTLMADVGCGNGKYLSSVNGSVTIGCDRSQTLCKISAERGFKMFACDCLAVPLRDGVFDAAICIAVIHHLSTLERRTLAIQQLIRILCTGGKCLIYVWALEQERHKQLSKYIKESKAENSEQCQPQMETTAAVESHNVVDGVSQLTVHTNRTHFKSKDMLVPWHLKGKDKEGKSEEKDAPVYHRYYHLFTEGELEQLCTDIGGVKVCKSYYDNGNWCVILEKL